MKRRNIVESMCIAVFFVAVLSFFPFSSLSATTVVLSPAVQGTIPPSCVGCNAHMSGCRMMCYNICDALHDPPTDLAVGDIGENVGTNCFLVFSLTSALQFNVASAREQFIQGNIKATLKLVFMPCLNLGLYESECTTGQISIYDYNDIDEDGISVKYSSSAKITDVIFNQAPEVGSTLSIDVTSAVSHDLFASGQTYFSAFYLGGSTDLSNHAYHSYAFNNVRLVIEPETLITLSAFNAKPEAGKIKLLWSTASELDNAGFNLYRAEAETGEYKKINAALIPAKGSATQAAEYEFTDKDVRLWKTYYYKLEDIDLNGVSSMHGPVSATVRLIR